MKVLIADDEPLARARLRRIVEEIDDYQVAGEASDGKDALLMSGRLNPDIILLDIRMPGMDGLEAAMHLSNLENPPAIIFTTAFGEHALEAFDSQAVDYVLKPIRRDRLQEALEKAHKVNRAQLMALGKQDVAQRARTHISAQYSGKIELIPIENVLYFRAEQKYVTVRHTAGEVLIDESLKYLEEEFGDLLLRIHRSALVAQAHIDGLYKSAEGGWMISFRDSDDRLEISRRHVTSVRKQLKQMKK